MDKQTGNLIRDYIIHHKNLTKKDLEMIKEIGKENIMNLSEMIIFHSFPEELYIYHEMKDDCKNYWRLNKKEINNKYIQLKIKKEDILLYILDTEEIILMINDYKKRLVS